MSLIRRHPRLATALLLAAGCFFALAIFEFGLRLTGRASYLYPPVRWLNTADLELGFRLTPNFRAVQRGKEFEHPIWTNEAGCFDDPYIEGEKKEILLLGDSFAHSYAPFDEKWGTGLEKLTGLEVAKCGVSGYGTRQEYLFLRKLRPLFRPSLVVVAYFAGNDLLEDALGPRFTTVWNGYLVRRCRLDFRTGEKKCRSREEIERRGRAWTENRLFRARLWFGSHLAAWNFLKGLLGSAEGAASGKLVLPYIEQNDEPNGLDWLGAAWEAHLGNLLAIRDYCRENNLSLLVVVVPSAEQVYPERWRREFGSLERKLAGEGLRLDRLAPNDKIERLCREEGLECLDLLPDFERRAHRERSVLTARDLYYNFDPHWNVRGNGLAALLAARRVLEMDLVRTAGKREKLEEIDRRLRSRFGD